MPNILLAGGTGEITEKKSRFIAQIAPAKDEAEAMAFAEAVKKKHWDARHNCYAYITAEAMPLSRCSDDGEPSGTAGRPILDVLTGADLVGVCAVVTRYFGGVLLGTGGLTRAYSQAAKEALKACSAAEKMEGMKEKISFDYSDCGRAERFATDRGIPVLEKLYGEKVSFTVIFPVPEERTLMAGFTDCLGGRVSFSDGEKVSYAAASGRVILL